MSETPPEPSAAARVADDPFWSVVRRRHPDLDIVLLPEEPAGSEAATEIVTLTDEDVTGLDEDAAAWWARLVDEESAGVARWVVGGERGVVRRETGFAIENVDPVIGTGVVARAGERLRAAGWRVLSPPDGLPRVLASRADGAGRDELQLVLAPATGRLSLRVRSAGVRVGHTVAHDLLTGAR